LFGFVKIGIGKEKRFSSVRRTPEGVDNFIRKIKLHGSNPVSAARRVSHTGGGE
jgi:hypothetical protein